MSSLSGDGVAFEDFIGCIRVLDERRKMPRAIYRDSNECGNVLPKFLGIELRIVTRDDTSLFELAQSFAD